MKRLIIISLGCILCLNAIAQVDYSYIRREVFLADSLYKSHDVEQSFYHRGKIIDFFRENRKQCLRDDSISLLVFESCYIYSNHQISTIEKISCLNQALCIVESNPEWIDSYDYKQHIVNLYNIYVGYLIEEKLIKEAQRGNRRLLRFAEQHYRIGLPDVLLSVGSSYYFMGVSGRSTPIYKSLYNMFDELDKIQQYEVLKYLINLKFNAKDYEDVIALATKHTKLIRWINDEVKSAVLDIISFSFEKVALEKSLNKNRYLQKVDDSYVMAYNWVMENNEVYLPKIIVCWAYYRYQWNGLERKAIPLFYEFLDFMQNKDKDAPLFDEYCKVEDVQQAIISIIVQQIYNTSSPIDINELMNKYDRVFYELIYLQKGKYYQEFIKTIETAYTICYGENGSYK